MILPVLYFTGCNKHDEITSPKDLNYDSPQYALIDYNDLLNGVEDATLDNEMVFSNSLYSYGFINLSSFVQSNASSIMMSITGDRGNWIIKFDWIKHLGLFFRGLNLSDAQKSQLKDLTRKFHDDMKPLVGEFRTANADIIAKANAERKAIVDKVKAGTLTREEAKPLLDALNKKTRNDIANNPASLAVKKKICDAKADLISKIGSILSADQRIKWNDKISKIPDPCK